MSTDNSSDRSNGEQPLEEIDIGELLDSLASSCDGFMSIESAVAKITFKGRRETVSANAPDALIQAAYDAIRYRIGFESGRQVFEPVLLMPNESQPAAVTDQTDDVVRAWQSLRDKCSTAVWRARFGHLVVYSKKLIAGTARRDLASAVIEEYNSIPDSFGDEFDSLDIRRASLSIARQFNLPMQRQQIAVALVGRADVELDSLAPRPGIALQITHTLIEDKSTSAVDRLLSKAKEVFKDDPHQGDAVIEQQLQRASSADVKSRLWGDRVAHWLHVADNAAGPLRAYFLTRAVELATLSQQPSLVEHATSRLQTVTLESLQLQGFRIGIIHRKTEIAQSVRGITDASTWQEAFSEFSLLPPPSGDYAANHAAVVAQHNAPSLSTLLRNVRHGGDGLPRFTVTTDAEQFEYDLVQHETRNMQLSGLVLTEGLLRLQGVHGLPPEREFQVFLMASETIDSALARALIRGFYRWWAGDYEGAAFTVSPRIETLARDLLRILNAGIYRVERDKRPGQYPGLGVLLVRLYELGALPVDWHRYLGALLTSQAGLNLRNELSHGFVDDIDATMSAFLLHAAAFMSLLPQRISIVTSSDAEQEGGGPTGDVSTDQPDGPPTQ